MDAGGGAESPAATIVVSTPTLSFGDRRRHSATMTPEGAIDGRKALTAAVAKSARSWTIFARER
jgi:hypothetical protein